MKTWKNIFLASMYTLALGCSGNNGSGLDDFASTDPGDSSSDTTAPADSPLYLIVKSTLDGADTSTVRTSNCHIPAGTGIGNPGTGLPAAAYGSCSVSLPELTLYHSKLEFIVGTTDANVCEKVSFYPFYYTRSTTNDMPQVGTTDLDCSVSPRSPKCYGGAAPAIVEGFPNNTRMFHLPTTGLSHTYSLKSAQERKETDLAPSIWTSNADVANAGFSAIAVDLPDGTIPSASNIRYIVAEPSNPDYVVTCEDKWGSDIYTLTLTIRDEDSTAGGYVFDHYWDWLNP